MLVSVILSLKAFRLRWPPAYRWFSVLLFTALATEVAANLWLYWLHNFNGMKYNGNTAWIFTVSLIPQYLLFMTVYYLALHSRRIKTMIIIAGILFSSFVIINAFYIQGFKIMNSYSHIFASAIMLLLALAYFEQARKEKELVKLSEQPMTWISLGSLIFHLISIPYLLFMNYLISNFMSIATAFYYVFLLTIFASYVLYSKAFLCKTPQLK